MCVCVRKSIVIGEGAPKGGGEYAESEVVLGNLGA